MPKFSQHDQNRDNINLAMGHIKRAIACLKEVKGAKTESMQEHLGVAVNSLRYIRDAHFPAGKEKPE